MYTLLCFFSHQNDSHKLRVKFVLALCHSSRARRIYNRIVDGYVYIAIRLVYAPLYLPRMYLEDIIRDYISILAVYRASTKDLWGFRYHDTNMSENSYFGLIAVNLTLCGYIVSWSPNNNWALYDRSSVPLNQTSKTLSTWREFKWGDPFLFGFLMRICKLRGSVNIRKLVELLNLRSWVLHSGF